mgnify:CR=1 FL=1
MKKAIISILVFSSALLSLAAQTLPVTGTFINLPYQDVRNKYTNPKDMDCTSPELWRTKIHEMKDMGMEYLVFMSVANEQKAYYPSKLMPWHYPSAWRSGHPWSSMPSPCPCRTGRPGWSCPTAPPAPSQIFHQNRFESD